MKTNGTTPIPQGYKVTPLGIIPQEWKTIRLKECFSISAGRDVQKDCFSPFFSSQYKYPIYSNSLSNHGLYGFTSHPRHIANSITITGRGTLGHAEYRDTNFDAIVRLLVLSPKIPLDGQFITEYINFRKPFFYESTGVPQLTAPQIVSTQIVFPPLIEQQKIAEVLGTWDKAIEKQSQLIKKLELRKKGLMQQLLTTKRRLPGFSDPWKEVRLGEISKIGTGNKNNEDKVVNGKYPFFVRSSNVERINSYSYDGEAILIPGEGKIGGIIHYVNGKFDYHQRVYKISNFSNCLGKYLYYYLMCFFGKQATNNSVKACVDSLRLSTFTNMKILYPSFEEQTAIAEALTAADREIELAQQKFELLRQQKRGLMQQLLTGKKRVKF